MACKFCDNILDKNEFLKIDENDRPLISLIYNSENKKYALWNECDDYFYSGISLDNVKYCPICGRRLYAI